MSAEGPSAVTDEAVIEIIRAELVDSGVEPETITPDALFDDLDVDSLDTAQLLATIKTRCGVNIREDLAGVTVGGLVAMVVAGAGT